MATKNIYIEFYHYLAVKIFLGFYSEQLSLWKYCLLQNSPKHSHCLSSARNVIRHDRCKQTKRSAFEIHIVTHFLAFRFRTFSRKIQRYLITYSTTGVIVLFVDKLQQEWWTAHASRTRVLRLCSFSRHFFCFEQWNLEDLGVEQFNEIVFDTFFYFLFFCYPFSFFFGLFWYRVGGVL